MPTLTGYDPGVHLSITDVAIDSREAPSMVSLRIKASKTDPFRAGVIRDALSSVGFNPAPYSGHSFRIGAATSAAAEGIEDAVIKILGRWSSSAYLAYVRIPRSELSGVSHRMAA